MLTASLFLTVLIQDPKLPVRREETIEGWTVHIDRRLSEPKNEALGKQAHLLSLFIGGDGVPPSGG